MDLAKFIDKLVARFIGTKHERDIKKLRQSLRPSTRAKPKCNRSAMEDLKTRLCGAPRAGARTIEGRRSVEPATYKLATAQALEPAMCLRFALVREAGRRFLNMRHFDVQLIAASFCTKARSRK